MKNFTLFRRVFTLLVILSVCWTHAQVTGDFRSLQTGNWNSASTWQVYNGSAWVAASQFPGQTDGNYTVNIQSGHEVKVQAPGVAPADNTYNIGALNVYGQLTLNADFQLYTTGILSLPGGTIFWNATPTRLTLPAGAQITITGYNGTNGLQGGKPCSNSKDLFIGTAQYTACQGNGNMVGDFSEINNSGGSFRSQPSADSTVLCAGNVVTLYGYENTVSDLTYQWAVVSSPSAYILPVPVNTRVIGPLKLTVPGIYVFSLSVSKSGFTITEEITVTVNGSSAASSAPTLCIGTILPAVTHTTTGVSGIINNGVSGANGLPAGVSASWSNNLITISGTPAVSGIFAYSIPLLGTCGTANGTITVTAAKTVSAASYSPVLCEGTVLAPITHSVAGATGIGASTGLPSGVTPSLSGNTITISGTPTQAGTFNYSIPIIGGCGEAYAKGTIKVNPKIVAEVSISAVPSEIICPGTAVTFTAAPTNGGVNPTYQWKVNGVNVGNNSVSFSSAVLKNNDVVTLVMTTDSSIPCYLSSSVISNAVTVSYQTTVFNGTWSIPPSSNLSAEIRSEYSSLSNLSFCALRVTNNAPVTLKSGHAFTVQNGVTVDSGSSMTVESGANLVQIADGYVNTGNITVKTDIKIGEPRTQYNFLGSPVVFMAGESFKTIYPGTAGVLYYNEADNFFYNSTGVNIPGRGLAVKEPAKPQVPSGMTKVTAQYKGVPQNGIINFPMVNTNITGAVSGYNLLGNPFSSNIDLVKLYNLNGGNNTEPQVVSPDIGSTFYFWDNEVNNGVALSQQGSSYKGQAYALFNVLTGTNGTGTAAGSLNGGTVIGNKIPTHIVKVGQGFIGRSLKSNYALKYNNAIRTSQPATVDFLGKNAVSDDRYWLTMITPANLTSNIAVVYFRAGTPRFGAEDSESRGGSDELYSIVEDRKAAINGKGSFNDEDVISLGTKHFTAGQYTISLGGREGVFAGRQQIFLKDRQTGVIANLNETDYTFEAVPGESSGRFEVIYKPQSGLSTVSDAKEDLVIYREGNDFVVKTQHRRISVVEAYDSSGRLVVKQLPNSSKTLIHAEFLTDGLYILKINLDGTVVAKKIIK